VRAVVLVGPVVTAIAGCFDPAIPTGAPCDPAVPMCPDEQSCVAGPAGYTCELAPGAPDAEGADAPPGAPDGPAAADAPFGTPDALPAADAAPVHVEYVATIAECLDPEIPDPAECRGFNGPAQLVLDNSDSTTNDPWYGYVRFDLDGAIAGRTVTSVVLRLTATNDPKADGPNTGVVWAVDPFDLTSLTGTTPQHVGTTPLAGSQGSVVELEVVDWPLPAGAVVANTPVYLGLETPSGDGVNYWNLAGPDPPRLIVDAQ
jgi:hypothetical protein